MTPATERRSAVLTPKEIDAIAEAVSEKMSPGMGPDEMRTQHLVRSLKCL